jgi:hypothetical protein
MRQLGCRKLTGVTNVPTDRRATVRLLIRGGTPFAGEHAQRKMGGYLVIVLGEAKQADWPGTTVRVGDVEGIVWTTPRQVTTVVNNLRAVAGVLDAHGESEDQPPGAARPPQRR